MQRLRDKSCSPGTLKSHHAVWPTFVKPISPLLLLQSQVLPLRELVELVGIRWLSPLPSPPVLQLSSPVVTYPHSSFLFPSSKVIYIPGFQHSLRAGVGEDVAPRSKLQTRGIFLVLTLKQEGTWVTPTSAHD